MHRKLNSLPCASSQASSVGLGAVYQTPRWVQQPSRVQGASQLHKEQHCRGGLGHERQLLEVPVVESNLK